MEWSAEESQNSKKWRRGRRSACIVVGCVNHRHRVQSPSPEITRFGLPQNSKLRLRWLALIDREDLADAPSQYYQDFKVCEVHFDPNDMLELDCGGGEQCAERCAEHKKLVRRGAVPTLQLPMFANIMGLASALNETDIPQQCLGQFHGICNRFLTDDLAMIVKTQAWDKLDKELKKSMKYKQFCLNLFHTNPQAYMMLQKTLSLPPTKNVKKMAIPYSTHLSEEIILILKSKIAKMIHLHDRQCAVTVGKIDLKTSLFYNIKKDRIIGFSEIDGIQKPTPANQAVIIMAQGICSNWKQLITFALLSPGDNVDEISKWIDSILVKLFEIGLEVRAVVSDPENDFIRTSWNNRITTIDNFFHLNGKKIYYFYDISLLIKMMYHFLLSGYTFYYEHRHVAKLEHLKQLYELDKVKKTKLVEQLKEEHLDPSKMSTLTIQDATQVFSKAVGIAISTYVHFEALSDSAMDTAQFIILMSKLHKTLTKGTLKIDIHMTFLIRMINLLHSLKLFAKNGEMIEIPKFIEAFQMTVMSTMGLLEDTEAEGHKFIGIKNLQHDSLFAIVREIQKKFVKGKTNPTSRQFISGFRSLYFSPSGKPPTGRHRTQDYRNELFNCFAELFKGEDLETPKDPQVVQLHAFTEVSRADYNKLKIQQNDSVVLICGYILQQCYSFKHTCRAFKSYLDRNKKRKGKSYAVFHNYITENPYTLRAVAPDEFVFYIERLEQTFYNVFEEKHIRNPIASSIYEQIKDLTRVPVPCNCSNFPINYIQKLYIRLRMYFMIKHNNIGFRNNQEFSV